MFRTFGLVGFWVWGWGKDAQGVPRVEPRGALLLRGDDGKEVGAGVEYGTVVARDCNLLCIPPNDVV